MRPQNNNRKKNDDHDLRLEAQFSKNVSKNSISSEKKQTFRPETTPLVSQSIEF